MGCSNSSPFHNPICDVYRGGDFNKLQKLMGPMPEHKLAMFKNRPDFLGFTPVCYAIYHNNILAVKYLVKEFGCEVRTTNVTTTPTSGWFSTLRLIRSPEMMEYLHEIGQLDLDNHSNLACAVMLPLRVRSNPMYRNAAGGLFLNYAGDPCSLAGEVPPFMWFPQSVSPQTANPPSLFHLVTISHQEKSLAGILTMLRLLAQYGCDASQFDPFTLIAVLSFALKHFPKGGAETEKRWLIPELQATFAALFKAGMDPYLTYDKLVSSAAEARYMGMLDFLSSMVIAFQLPRKQAFFATVCDRAERMLYRIDNLSLNDGQKRNLGLYIRDECSRVEKEFRSSLDMIHDEAAELIRFEVRLYHENGAMQRDYIKERMEKFIKAFYDGLAKEAAQATATAAPASPTKGATPGTGREVGKEIAKDVAIGVAKSVLNMFCPIPLPF